MPCSVVLFCFVVFCFCLVLFFAKTKVLSKLFVDLLMEDLNEELYMASQAGLGLSLYLTKVFCGKTQGRCKPTESAASSAGRCHL